MGRRKSIIISLLIICFVAVSSLFALVISGCSSKKFNGKYIFGTMNGEVYTYLSINGKTLTFVSKTDTAEYSFKSSGNEITLDTGVKFVFAEGGDVVFMPHKLQWSNGYTNSLNVFGPLRQRDGYFSQIFSTETGGVVTSEIVFSNDGTFGMMSYFNNQITGYSFGTYEFNSGLLTINDKSSENVEQLYFYVDENYNIYVTAGVKEASELYTPDSNISGGNQGGNGDINIPDTPNVPDEPEKPDTPEIPPVKKYTLTYAAGDGGRIIGALSQTVESGKDGSSVIAMPDDGYEFIGWSDGVQTAERQDTNITTDIVVTAQFEKNNNDFVSGAGTKERPYAISNIEQLRNILKYPNSHFMLINDMVFDETSDKQNFTPLFSDDNMFNGSFDGNGHKIVNLTIYNDTTFYTGLFACIGASGCVKNLTLENVSLSGTNYIGGIAGYSLGEICDCTVSGEITYLPENSYKVFVGGIVGRMENKLDKCTTDVNIICSDFNSEANIGGIAGYLLGDREMEITNSSSIGEIVWENSTRAVYAGGLIGSCASSLTIGNSYTTGAVTANDDRYIYVGGLVGHSGSSITINNSYTAGAITGIGYDVYAGGLVGYCGFSSTINNSYTTGTVTATVTSSNVYGASCCVGGLVGYGYYNSSIISNSYTTGAVTGTGYDVYAGGLVGHLCSASTTISNSYTTGAVTATVTSSNVYEASLCAGGLVGYQNGSNLLKINNSNTTGAVTATGNDVYVGGLVGYHNSDYSLRIGSSYTTGAVTATGDYVYVGGFVGRCSDNSDNFDITSSYTVSKISVTSNGTVYSGAFAGRVENFKLTNAHWLYYADNEVEYAIGYGESNGIPSSIGSIKHLDISDFYTLAEELNNGLDEPVWENIDATSLPALKHEEEN